MFKKLTLYFSAAALILMFATACKKDNKSQQELIAGKWMLQSYEWYEKDGSDEDEGTDDESASGYYLDFKSDGTVIVNMYGSTETVEWEIKDGKLTLDGTDAMDISTLNDKNLSLHSKETDTDFIYEQWYHFKK